MSSSDPLPAQILLQVILILLNAVFASAEIAVISLNDNMLKRKADGGNKKAKRLVKLTDQPARFLATIQIGITLAGFLGSAFAADNFADRLLVVFQNIGIAIPRSVCVVIITIIISYFTLILGELVPKRIAQKKAEALSMALANLIYFLSIITKPIVSFLTASTNFVLRLLRINPEDEDEEVTEEEIRIMVDIGSEKGTIDPQEKQMIENVFEFDNKTVDEIMTHRTDVSVLWTDESLDEWIEDIEKSNHSRMLVCGKSVDDVVGILVVRDFYEALHKGVRTLKEILEYLQPPMFVPEMLSINVLFQNMQKQHSYFAIVLDEYGGLSGIVTVNDLLEEIVGQLPDNEMEEGIEPDIIQLDSSTWRMRGTVRLDMISKMMSLDLPIEDYDTLGGLIINELGIIPKENDKPSIEAYGLAIKVEEVKARRIEWALVTKTESNVKVLSSADENK